MIDFFYHVYTSEGTPVLRGSISRPSRPSAVGGIFQSLHGRACGRDGPILHRGEARNALRVGPSISCVVPLFGETAAQCGFLMITRADGRAFREARR